ncbi:acylphosphatase [Vampirovibrio sp.]|uniref:acylphosphatase n=1 Tax=Vampirovibrio sp. TaxID=2717857 RepID=UPI0035937B3F
MPSSRTTHSMAAKRVLISGKVQGVGFRYALAELARSLNIQGWCRNLASGEVEASFQGEASQVMALMDWLRQGPPGAVVAQVVVEDQAILEPLLGESIQTFEIRK